MSKVLLILSLFVLNAFAGSFAEQHELSAPFMCVINVNGSHKQYIDTSINDVSGYVDNDSYLHIKIWEAVVLGNRRMMSLTEYKYEPGITYWRSLSVQNYVNNIPYGDRMSSKDFDPIIPGTEASTTAMLSLLLYTTKIDKLK